MSKQREMEAGAFQVLVYRDGKFWGTERYSKQTITVGRSTEADLQLDDDITSRNHANISLADGGLLVEDLGSSNGTYVNGEQVKRRLISANDEVSIGSFTLRFKFLGKRRQEKPQLETRMVDGRDPSGRMNSAGSPVVVSDELQLLARGHAGRGGHHEQAPAAPSSSRRDRPSRPMFDMSHIFSGGLPQPRGRAFAVAGEEDLDEDDIEELEWVEPFSLLNNLVSENFAEPALTEPRIVLEVISYDQDKRVTGYDQLQNGQRYKIGEMRQYVLVEHNRRGDCKLRVTENMTGGLILDGKVVQIDDFRTPENKVWSLTGEQMFATSLREGDFANIMGEDSGWFMRFVNPLSLPPPPRFRLDSAVKQSLIGSGITHLLILAVIAFMGVMDVGNGPIPEEDRFAKIDMKDIEVEKPEEPEVPLDEPPPPEPPKEKEKEKEKVKPEPEKKPEKIKPVKIPPKPVKAPAVKEPPSREPPSRAGANRGPPSKEPPAGDNSGGGVGMMMALGNLNQKKTSANIVTAVTNLDAVRVPGGAAPYKVGGLVTKLPTSSVVLSRGLGVGVKGGIELLRGGKGGPGMAGIGPGALTGGTTGQRGVGGVVFKAPTRSIQVRGTLSREAIDAVVRQHIQEVQYCYEKNLMAQQNLSGKIQMEWTIATDGSVTVVKTAQNTMSSPAVAMCVSGKIKAWRFPQPKGGIVVVNYPFVFNPIGF